MSHDAQLPRPERVSLEGRILRLLCSDSLSREEKSRAINEVDKYAWCEPEHDVLFQAIRRIGACDGRRLREELPAQLTRMGFPDVNWDQYFVEGNAISDSMADLISLLIRQR